MYLKFYALAIHINSNLQVFLISFTTAIFHPSRFFFLKPTTKVSVIAKQGVLAFLQKETFIHRLINEYIDRDLRILC